MTNKHLILRTGSKRLTKVWFAGSNPREFTQSMKAQEVENLSIPSLCDTIDYSQGKRAKFTVNTEFDWRDLKDIEVDNESTIETLKSSEVMNHDQISLRDVMDEPEPEPELDPTFDNDEFDIDNTATTQRFLEIRELVTTGRSIMQIFQNESFNPIPLTERNDGLDHQSECDEDEYGPLAFEQNVPLPDVETYQQELEMEVMPPDVDNTTNNQENPETSASINVPAWLDNDLLNNIPTVTKRATKEKKRKRRAIDTTLQLKIGDFNKPDVKLFRCLSARLDCINKFDLLRHSQTRLFMKPSHVLKDLKPRYFKETPALMVGLERAKRIKRQEQTDQVMLNDFLNSISDQPQQDKPISNTTQRLQSSDHERIAEGLQHEAPNVQQDDYRDEPMGCESEFEPQVESMDFYEPENSRIVKQREPNEHQEMSIGFLNESSKTYQLRNESPKTYEREDVPIPRSVLKMLNQFVTIDSSKPSSYGSQALFVLKNQKNREKCGLKGVLQKLLRLWNSNIHPIGMTELMYPNKEKFAAALAFYSIMELNSLRIGLILIEKYENSNTVYNIKKSPQLINLLQ